MKKNRLDKASDHRRDANALFEKAYRLKPFAIILTGTFLVAGITGNFALAGVAIVLAIFCLTTASHWSRQAERRWMTAHDIVRKERTFSSRSMAARRRLVAEENSAHGRPAGVRLLNTPSVPPNDDAR